MIMYQTIRFAFQVLVCEIILYTYTYLFIYLFIYLCVQDLYVCVYAWARMIENLLESFLFG
jgi:hypothetical protein